MKKRLLTVMCIFMILGLCACQKEENESFTSQPAEETVQVEALGENAKGDLEEEQTLDAVEEETMPEEPAVPEASEADEEQVVSEISEEAGESVVEVPASVFEAVSVELTTYPILKYTIMGEERQLDYKQYEGMYMYDMVSDPLSAIGYQTGDVTGDGLEELIVSIYVVGNNLSDAWQDTYVYSIDADINDLNEILYISSMGGEQFVPGYSHNVGAYPTQEGTLRLDVSTMKGDGGAPPQTSSVELVCQDGMWSVK